MSAYTCMMDFIHSGCYEILRSRSVSSRYMDMYVDGVLGPLGIINLQFFFLRFFSRNEVLLFKLQSARFYYRKPLYNIEMSVHVLPWNIPLETLLVS